MGPTLRIETPRVFAPLCAPARYKGAHGGRGSGKSHFFAELLVERAAFEDGFRAVCIREVQKSIKGSVKLLVEDKIRTFGLQQYFDIKQDEIVTSRGGQIQFQGMQNHTAESIKSLEGFDVAWGEEAQSLSERSLSLLRPTIRKPGSELWFSWNPGKESDPVDALLRCANPPPDSIVVEANYADNPWFDQTTLREEMEYDRRRDPDKYAHIWCGKYQSHSSSRVFRNWRIAKPDEEFPEAKRFYFGADWGFSIDPTALVRCFIVGRTLYVDYEAYKIGCEIDNTPALFDTVPGARKWPITADSSRPETISYMRRHGYENITHARKGKGSVEEGIEFLKTFDIVVHERCKHMADELSFYSYETDKKTDEVLPVLKDEKNHLIDALRYAVEPTRRATGGVVAAPLILSAARPGPG